MLNLVMLVIPDITFNDSAYYSVVTSNPTHGKVYSILPFSSPIKLTASLIPADDEIYSKQHYVIKFLSDFWQVGRFLRFPPPIKLTITI
jgi:hypothetical protein